MQIITADWETYYDKDYSLSKLTTEEYVRSPQFEAIMLGLRWPDGSKQVITGTHAEIEYQLQAIEWDQYAVLCHNTIFDAAIFAWRFNVKPKAWLDTLSMARAMFGVKGNSLAALAKRYNLADKGTEVLNALGKRRADFTKQQFDAYAEYCLHDVELCHQLFELMSMGWYDLEEFDKREPYPIKELELIDKLIRMYTEPHLVLNKAKLEAHLTEVVKAKEDLLAKCTAGKADLMSNAKFADLLLQRGVLPPRKISPTTGKETYAFAKTDPGMKALLEHPDPEVQALAAARMGVKSTLEETRTQRFIDMAERDPYLPIPLKYSAARTHRLGGMDQINMQNLPSRGVQAGKLKGCIEAPPGYVLIDCDSSNIEARMLAWLAGQDDLVEDFANGVDTYCKLASKVFGREVTNADKKERFVGKTVVLGCLAEETLVLCERGWTPIQHVTEEDRVWDGQTWVKHQGLLKKGLKETLNVYGLWLTPDHKVLCGTEWKDAQSVLQDENSLSQILVTGAESLPLQATWPVQTGGSQRSSSDVTAADRSTPLSKTTSSISEVLAATCARWKKRLQTTVKSTGFTLKLCQMTSIGNACLTDYLPQSAGAITSATVRTKVTAEEASLFAKNGETTNQRSYTMSKLFQGGITHFSRWIGLTTIAGTDQTTSGLSLEERTLETDARSQLCKSESTHFRKNLMTYDLLMAGPRNRFTVLTGKGPVIVHNCGYQTGATKLQATLKASEFALDLPMSECENIIDTYRSGVPQIVRLWRQGDVVIETMHKNKTMWFGREGVALAEGRKGIKLPSGLYISYPQLHRGHNKRGQESWQYKDEKGLTDLYGGKLTENVVQALARIVVMYQLLKISKKLRVVLTVHDSVVAIARKEEAAQATAFVEECMRWIPKWAQGCPINCKSDVSDAYGQ